MKLSKCNIIILVFCIAALSTVLLLPLLNPKSDMQHAIEQAVNYLEQSDEPYALLWCNVIYRRFGITEFSDALDDYDQILSEDPENAALLRIFRRIADHNNVIETEDLGALTADVDKIVVPALYCDQMALPDNYTEMLANAVILGDYQLTHVLLAWIFIQENGCNLSLPDGFIEDTYFATAALINSDQKVTDKELEAAAFLYITEQDNLVDNTFVDQVISAQHNDGGWSITGKTIDKSNWHPTILALLLLLHTENPADSYPSILD